MSKELEAKIEKLEKDLTDVKASVNSQISDVVADLKESITAQVKEEVAAAMGIQVAEEAKPVTPFDSLTLEVGKRKFKFNFPSVAIESKNGYQKFTAEEICDKLNADVAKKLVAMYDAEETLFITEIN